MTDDKTKRGPPDSQRINVNEPYEVSYRYPFTWIPASMLYNAVRTRDGDRYRGIFIVHEFTPPPNGG